MSARLTDERLQQVAAMPAAALCLTLTVDETHALAAELVLARAVINASRPILEETEVLDEDETWDGAKAALAAYDKGLL